MEGFENEVGKLKEENISLKVCNESMLKMILKLIDEVKYFCSVLVNESIIMFLLKSVVVILGIFLIFLLL